MTLTAEDRRRIYEEEKARLEAQERARAELKKSKIGFGKVCLIAILGFVGLGVVNSLISGFLVS